MNKRKILLILPIILLFCAGIYFLTVNYYNIQEHIERKIALIKDQKSEKPEKYSVVLSGNEKDFLISNMKMSKHYLEFGSGGSTFLALLNSNDDVVSVENDANWIKHLKKWKFIKDESDKGRLKFYYANTGKIGGYGWPKAPETDKLLFPNYSRRVFKDLPNNYDLVLVDGRFRVACTLQTILNTDDNVKIIIHDFTVRPHYNAVLEFLTVEKTVDTMVLLKKKQNIDKNKVVEMYENYKYDCR